MVYSSGCKLQPRRLTPSLQRRGRQANKGGFGYRAGNHADYCPPCAPGRRASRSFPRRAHLGRRLLRRGSRDSRGLDANCHREEARRGQRRQADEARGTEQLVQLRG